MGNAFHHEVSLGAGSRFYGEIHQVGVKLILGENPLPVGLFVVKMEACFGLIDGGKVGDYAPVGSSLWQRLVLGYDGLFFEFVGGSNPPKRRHNDGNHTDDSRHQSGQTQPFVPPWQAEQNPCPDGEYANNRTKQKHQNQQDNRGAGQPVRGKNVQESSKLFRLNHSTVEGEAASKSNHR